MESGDGLSLDHVYEVFEASTDFTFGMEEEFALLDPETLELVPRFEQLNALAAKDPILSDSAAGELISSEIEIRSGRAESFREVIELQRERSRILFDLAAEEGLALASMGTHPWADYRDQKIIDTPHYHRVRDELQYVARRNNTWSVHLHVGVRGADRAIAVCDHLREILPLMLAVSGNSPYLEGADSGLDSVRTQIFTRSFPRCGIPGTFGTWREYADFVDLLKRTGSIVEATQLWWSIRPHHSFGTVELRICDAQSTAEESTELAGLIAAVIAQTAIDYDEHGYDGGSGAAPFGPGAGPPLGDREIEENLWRAIRYGISGSMIDFRTGTTVPTEELAERLFAWTEPARKHLGIDTELPLRNGSARFRELVAEHGSMREAYCETVRQTQVSYSGREALVCGQGGTTVVGGEA